MNQKPTYFEYYAHYESRCNWDEAISHELPDTLADAELCIKCHSEERSDEESRGGEVDMKVHSLTG